MPVRSQTRRGELGPMANGVAKGANNLGGTAAPLANLGSLRVRWPAR